MKVQLRCFWWAVACLGPRVWSVVLVSCNLECALAAEAVKLGHAIWHLVEEILMVLCDLVD